MAYKTKESAERAAIRNLTRAQKAEQARDVAQELATAEHARAEELSEALRQQQSSFNNFWSGVIVAMVSLLVVWSLFSEDQGFLGSIWRQIWSWFGSAGDWFWDSGFKAIGIVMVVVLIVALLTSITDKRQERSKQ